MKSGTGTVVLSGNNNYTGGTTVSGGMLSISTSASLPGNLTLGAGTLQTTGSYTSDASTVNLTNPTAGIDTPNFAGDVTISGLITGSGGLNKSGPGTLELANVAGNNYRGDTNVLAGTLLATADNALSPNKQLGDRRRGLGDLELRRRRGQRYRRLHGRSAVSRNARSCRTGPGAGPHSRRARAGYAGAVAGGSTGWPCRMATQEPINQRNRGGCVQNASI